MDGTYRWVIFPRFARKQKQDLSLLIDRNNISRARHRWDDMYHRSRLISLALLFAANSTARYWLVSTAPHALFEANEAVYFGWAARSTYQRRPANGERPCGPIDRHPALFYENGIGIIRPAAVKSLSPCTEFWSWELRPAVSRVPSQVSLYPPNGKPKARWGDTTIVTNNLRLAGLPMLQSGPMTGLLPTGGPIKRWIPVLRLERQHAQEAFSELADGLQDLENAL